MAIYGSAASINFNYDDDFLSALLKGHPARGLGWSGPPISAMSAAEKKIAQQRAAAKAAEKTGFLYAPVGWQREDMGRALYERGGIFKRVLRDARAGAPRPPPCPP